MILGKGDIARALSDRAGAIIFACGVSNSNCADTKEFNRELNLLLDYVPSKQCLIYFSTISIYENNTPYIQHKLHMELAVRSYFKNYCIIRIGNIDWGTNPNTFLNFLRNKKKNNEPFVVRDEYKYMISRDQLRMVTSSVPLEGKNEICVFGRKVKVIDLI